MRRTRTRQRREGMGDQEQNPAEGKAPKQGQIHQDPQSPGQGCRGGVGGRREERMYKAYLPGSQILRSLLFSSSQVAPCCRSIYDRLADQNDELREQLKGLKARRMCNISVADGILLTRTVEDHMIEKILPSYPRTPEMPKIDSHSKVTKK